MKSFDGCWTCRLRKKRCDETRPACGNCSTLQISCHFGDEKPPWMDGGFKQRARAEEVKQEVRTAAARRRGTLPADSTSISAAQLQIPVAPIIGAPVQHCPISQISDPRFRHRGTNPLLEEAESDSALNQDETHEAFWNRPRDLPISDPVGGIPGAAELDRRFLMFYIDHFFPFLFPFYQPTLLEGGRTWIMELIVNNQAIWHTTLCLSTYFVSISLEGAVLAQHLCKNMAWEKLLKQMSVTFTMLQRDLQELNSSKNEELIIKTSRIMGSIIQLQRFEASVGIFENCQNHHAAAVAMFHQAIHAAEATAHTTQACSFQRVLDLLGRPIWAIKAHPAGAWGSDQAAFRFYTALLVVDDILLSTCTEEAPRLLQHHDQLLTSEERFGRGPRLNLDEFMGCETSVVMNIGEIAALDAWKKAAKKARQLDMMELVARASPIKEALLCKLARLDAGNTEVPKDRPQSIFDVYNNHLPAVPGGCSAFVTRVWGQAALLYLSIVISGWQPGSAATRQTVTRVLLMLEHMPSSDFLRTMVWPYCLVGCLAEPEEESRFRSLVDALVPQRLFGAVRKALEIMESVWRSRHKMDIDHDFAACVRGLGYVSLLV